MYKLTPVFGVLAGLAMALCPLYIAKNSGAHFFGFIFGFIVILVSLGMSVAMAGASKVKDLGPIKVIKPGKQVEIGFPAEAKKNEASSENPAE